MGADLTPRGFAVAGGPVAGGSGLSSLSQVFDAPAINRALSIVGRLGLVYLFCVSAVFHLTFGWTTTLHEMAARGVLFAVPLLYGAMFASVAFTLGLLFDVWARWCALGLSLYTLCVSSVIYTPGSHVAGADTPIFFMKDMAIFGALLMLSCALSINRRLEARLKQLDASPGAALDHQ